MSRRPWHHGWEAAAIALGFIALNFAYSWLFFAHRYDRLDFDLLEIWRRWDAEHYLDIAARGYPGPTEPKAGQIAFFPFYPALIRSLSWLPGGPLVASIVLSNGMFILSAVLFFRLLMLDFTKRFSLRAVFLLCAFPGAYFLSAPYTESTFLALSLLAFLCVRSLKPGGSTLPSLAAGLTRINGLVLGPALFLEGWLIQRGQGTEEGRARFWSFLRAALPLFAVGIGFLGYLAVNYVTFGNPLAFLSYQAGLGWGRALDFPWNGLLSTLDGFGWREVKGKIMVAGVESLTGLGLLTLSLWGFKRLRPSYALYLALSALLLTANTFWLSSLRISTVIFPIHILVARFCRRDWVFWLVGSAYVILHFFFLGHYINWEWAF